MKKTIIVISAIVLIFASVVGAAEKKPRKPSIAKLNAHKIKSAADMFSAELSKRGIKSVQVESFTDAKGAVTPLGKEVADELRRQIYEAAKGAYGVKAIGGEAVVRGTVLQFKGKDRWQMDVKLLKDGSVISAFEGLLLRKAEPAPAKKKK